jgi:hypothetical protein
VSGYTSAAWKLKYEKESFGGKKRFLLDTFFFFEKKKKKKKKKKEKCFNYFLTPNSQKLLNKLWYYDD